MSTDDATCANPHTPVTPSVRRSDQPRARPSTTKGIEWSTPISVWTAASEAAVPSSNEAVASGRGGIDQVVWRPIYWCSTTRGKRLKACDELHISISAPVILC